MRLMVLLRLRQPCASSLLLGRHAAWFELTCAEERLPGLEDHPIVHLKQLVNEEPRAIGRILCPVAVPENPIPVEVLDLALHSTELIIVELDTTRRHPANCDLLILLEGEDLIILGSINELKLYCIVILLRVALPALKISTCDSFLSILG